MHEEKTSLLGLSRKELRDFASSAGESPYRGDQLYDWLYSKRVDEFSLMTNLGKEFRSILQGRAEIGRLDVCSKRESKHDGTTKLLFELADGLKIETVVIPGPEGTGRTTLCVSSQVGCALDCAFCATATMGFRRNLSPGEIVGQVLAARQLTSSEITNIVFMGMGEPMLNYENVMKAVDILVEGVDVAARRITVSTAGLVGRIRQMGDEQRKVHLAVSLHSAVDATRSMIMPIAGRHPIRELIAAIEHYYRKTRRDVTFEHVFFDGINDSEKEISGLIRILRRVPSKINVIPFHPIDFTGPTGFSATLRPSTRLNEVVARLRAEKIPTFIRSSAGEDIEAACGQLAVEMRRREELTMNAE